MIELLDYPPPIEWRLPYTGPGIVLELPLARVNAICRLMGVRAGKLTVYSCSQWLPGGCLEIVASDVGVDDRRKLREVEDANCNGWPRGMRQ